ncbi:putative TOS1-like glycosyl hydrolase-domain-containing protein [Tricladium varicosporioides]|nr:putative TOS1-like glycosyl hydrolase-domain-containing protein [Hymenoscyphus varicosporioides]
MYGNIIVGGTAILLSLAGVNADQCAAGSKQVQGNWYCQPVQAIKYSNVGFPGTYNQITNMGADGRCSSTPKQFTGSLSPLDEEVSLHFRGPLNLKQIAVYTLSNTKREEPVLQQRGHANHHRHLHNRPRSNGFEHQVERDIVATINGQEVSWKENAAGAAAVQPAMITATIDGKVVSWPNPAAQQTQPPATSVAAQQNPAPAPTVATTAPASPAKSSSAPAPIVNGAYNRIGYYNAALQTLDNLVFLGNYGGQGSGVFDYKFGASLAYSNSAGTAGAASPQILADQLLPSDKEITVMLNKDCKDGGCGYSRPGSVAYHGFEGANKVFMFEFSMPSDGKSGGLNTDMPAIWMLNAQIPRTTQYGPAECSCWTTGCGEFDIVEALHTGSTFMKSTLHTNKPAGSSDYIERPTSKTMKIAVVFDSNASTVQVQVLPDNTQFPTSISTKDISGMCSTSSEKLTSLFKVS